MSETGSAAPLAVRRLTLANFRSHRRAEFTLDGRPVAIFGQNGAGKTSLLEAVSLLSPGRGLRRATLDEIARRPDAPGWKVTAELTRRGALHEVETSATLGGTRAVRIDDKPAPQTALGRLVPLVWLVPVMDRLWVEGAEGRRRFLDRLTLGFRPDHAEAALGYEKAMRERNRLLKDGIADPGWYAALELQMAEAGAQLDAGRRAALERLGTALEAAETAFPRLSLTLIGPDGAPAAPHGPDALRTAFAAGRPRDIAAGRSLTGPHRADLAARYIAKDLPARDCSTGEQKALLISLVLANARALREDTGLPPLLLLDEVAAHLDAGRRAALYDEIAALGAQAWMTGTGPELFAELGDRAQRLEVTESGGLSTVTAA